MIVDSPYSVLYKIICAVFSICNQIDIDIGNNNLCSLNALFEQEYEQQQNPWKYCMKGNMALVFNWFDE